MTRQAAYLLVFLVLTLEKPGDRMFLGHWENPIKPLAMLLFANIPYLKRPLWELLLVAVAAGAWTERGAWRRRVRPLDATLLVSVGALVLALLWGVARGGSAYFAFYQANALLVGVLTAAVLLAVTRSLAHLRELCLVVFAAALYRAALACYFYFVHVRGRPIIPPPPHMTTHDDSVLFVVALAGLLAWAVARGTGQAVLRGAAFAALILLAVQVNNRRLAWLELLAALALMYLLLPRRGLRRTINRTVPLLMPVLALYVAVGWGRRDGIFAPLGSLATVVGRREDPSSLSRNEENLNLVVTLRQNPLLGTGLGHEYVQVSGVFTPELAQYFSQYRYIPHNSLLGLLAFTGMVGLTGILLPLPAAAFLCARAYHHARRPWERTASMTACVSIVVYLIQAYGDMGLQSPTVNTILAVAVTVAGRLPPLVGAWGLSPPPRPASGPVPFPAGGLDLPTVAP